MIDAGDVQLERSGEPPEPPPPQRSRNAAVLAVAIVAAIVVVGVGWYVMSRKQTSPASPASVPVDRPAPVAVAPGPKEPLVTAADVDLPPLAQTDPIVRELVARLSSHPTVAAWLATDRLIAHFTVATLTVAEGRTPAPFLRAIAPRGPFRTARSGGEVIVDARAYERYNPPAEAIAALDAAGTASLYLTLEPRITEAYRDLGYPEGDFDRVLERAIGVLLRTPAIDEKVPLRPKAVTYAYGDPSLEALMPAQKQLLRMGPRNARIVRAKLAEIAQLLDLQPLNP